MTPQDKKSAKLLLALIAGVILAIILISFISTGHLVLK